MSAAAVRPAAGLRWYDDYYLIADLGEGAWAIGEPRYGQCNFSFLIAGSKRALLFDSGPGIRDIRPLAASLTDRPLAALPSHLHFDHVGKLAQMADVLLPDLPALRTQAQGDRIRLGLFQFLGFVEGFPRPTIRISGWLAPGSTLDLGDRQLTILSVPGHTPESVALLDTAANRIFAGDFIYPSDVYAQLPGSDLTAYAHSARQLLQRTDAHTRIYGAHGCDRLPQVDVPLLGRADLLDLARALAVAADSSAGAGWYPRRIPVNARMMLLAKYPWMLH